MSDERDLKSHQIMELSRELDRVRTAPLGDFTAAQAAKLAEIEAAPDAEESVREVLAVALYEETEAAEYTEWPDATPVVQRYCYRLADVAIAVLRGPSGDVVLPMCWDPSPAFHVGGVLLRQARCELPHGHGGAHQSDEGNPGFPTRWIHQ